MDGNLQLHNEREQRHYINYIDWGNSLESNMPQKHLMASNSI
jgi:hypothetical protein